jgi:hypothetical protein
LYNSVRGFRLNSGKQKTLVHLIVGNGSSARVTGRAVLASFHKQHSVLFLRKINTLFFLIY